MPSIPRFVARLALRRSNHRRSLDRHRRRQPLRETPVVLGDPALGKLTFTARSHRSIDASLAALQQVFPIEIHRNADERLSCPAGVSKKSHSHVRASCQLSAARGESAAIREGGSGMNLERK